MALVASQIQSMYKQAKKTKSSNQSFYYSLVLNGRRASFIRHNLIFPTVLVLQSCFLVKRLACLVLHPGFYFSCLLHSIKMMSLIHLWRNAKSTNPPWSLSFEFSGSCITARILKKSMACLLIQHIFF